MHHTSRRQKKLEKYVRKYFKAHPEVRVIGVAGSVGKTFAKRAVATVLSERYRVRLFHGNRGTNFSAPLEILGIDYPGDIRGWQAWHRIYRAARQRIKLPADVDVVVHEMNATGFGSIAQYADFIVPDIAIITAVSSNNLELFQSIDFVAQEQLSAVNISKSALINRDDIDGAYAAYITNPYINTFGTGGVAEYRFNEEDYSLESGYKGSLIVPEWEQLVPVSLRVHDEFSIRLAVAAAAVGVKFGLSPEDLSRGFEKIRPDLGRMNILRGVEDSILLDDTSNNSPLGVVVALRSLYQHQAPQRIAVIGSMSHLGQASAAEHQVIGELCDANQLNWVVVVGQDAAQYIVPAAKARGCQVKVCQTALEAGAFVHSVVEPGGVVLFSGSEDDVFMEEAIKIVLHSADDASSLVRQSEYWDDAKANFFSQFK